MRRILVLSMTILSACTAGEVGDDAPLGQLSGTLIAKDDAAGSAQLPSTSSYSDTAVWKVVNQWEDRSTAAAQQAGIAWAANSGLDWDQKYALWVGSLQQTPSMDGSYPTILISTPWGKTLPGPRTDCADLAILLRVSFAAWYGLPFTMVAGGSSPVYFGHFGIRTASGRKSGMPKFATAYTDYSSMTPAQYNAAWPKDASLRALHVGDDAVTFLQPGEGVGAYLDEIHLNKKVGHLIELMQQSLNTANLVDANNTYNLVPQALRTGDLVMYYYGPTGPGHALVMSSVTYNVDGTMQAQNISGDDPPAQARYNDTQWTRYSLTAPQGGSDQPCYGGQPCDLYGGGLRRWRVAKAQNGRWTNVYMTEDKGSWIDATNYAAIGARPNEFDQLMVRNDYAGQVASLVSEINTERQHLRQYPASCNARDTREKLFAQLHTLVAANEQLTDAQIDSKYRLLEDYVFAKLDYSSSKTCCWDSSTADMATSILAYAASEQQNGQCVQPTVFQMVNGAYDPFETYAKSQGVAWPAWQADEACTATSSTDTVDPTEAPLTAYCALTP